MGDMDATILAVKATCSRCAGSCAHLL